MRVLLLAIVFACGVAMTSAEAADGEVAGDEIQGIISSQINAFRRDDADKAFSFASPNIQKQFGTPKTFMTLVMRGYPQIYRAKSFRFGERRSRDGRAVQQVIVTGPQGSVVAAFYDMIRVDGQWRINGCQLARMPGQDV